MDCFENTCSVHAPLNAPSYQIPEGKKAMEFGLAATMPVMGAVTAQRFVSLERTSEVGHHTWHLRDQEGIDFIRERLTPSVGGAASSAAAPAPAPARGSRRGRVAGKAKATPADVKPILSEDDEGESSPAAAGVKRRRSVVHSGGLIDLTGANESAGEGRVH